MPSVKQVYMCSTVPIPKRKVHYSEREVFFEKNQKVTCSTTSLDRAEREVDGAGGGRGRVAVINKFDHITFSLNNFDNLECADGSRHVP